MTDDIVVLLRGLNPWDDDIMLEISNAADEIDRLRAALEKLVAACDAGRRYEKGIGGMTIEAQLARTVIYGVSASVVEDARAALEGEASDDAAP